MARPFHLATYHSEILFLPFFSVNTLAGPYVFVFLIMLIAIIIVPSTISKMEMQSAIVLTGSTIPIKLNTPFKDGIQMVKEISSMKIAPIIATFSDPFSFIPILTIAAAEYTNTAAKNIGMISLKTSNTLSPFQVYYMDVLH
jgi:hypothetical protein